MTKQEVRKLLGGYVTGTLRPGELRALFEAALDDQELFDELQHNEALRRVRGDPAARREVFAAVTPAVNPLRQRRSRWLWLAPAAALVSLVVAVTVFLYPVPHATRQVDIARVQVLPPAAEPASLGYTILKRTASAGFVPLSNALHTGDVIRIRVRVNTAGRIGLLQNSASASTVTQLPEMAAAGGQYLLPAAVTIQPDTTLALRFTPAEPRGNSVVIPIPLRIE